MKIFLDTANIDEIKRAYSLGVLDGVTTNPSTAAKENKNFEQIVKDILEVFKGTDGIVNLEVVSEKADDMIKEGFKLAGTSRNVVVKVPCTEDGLKACKVLSKKKVRVNITLCFSASQALLAAKNGAYIISPFIGRLYDQDDVGIKLIEEIRKIYDNYNFKTQILVASVRSPRDVVDAGIIGADICTVPYLVFEKLYKHPLTDIGQKKFLDDWYNYRSRFR